ncbi:low-density lipoprotein receptor-related protein 4-like isoform X3 [Hydractinia symbiolongicarpus]|uniref:low-density lipoprotein receptor-related protein 4-like isoform X3 n=1 Tax=Hydractinia symbiolongicarpus TaxID=13093 RepID=UPI00254FFCF1|nr:low-density lipoprotein receptor-related protein 4-like isoform X3 [Hydractinia symbiolongicarpus]
MMKNLFVFVLLLAVQNVSTQGCEAPCLFMTDLFSSIIQLPLSGSTGMPRKNALPKRVVSSRGLTTALEIDPIHQHIYWADYIYKSIHRSTLDGKNITTLFNYTIGYPSGLAVDWSSNILYWVDRLMKTIELSDTDGKHRKVIFTFTNGSSPMGLCVNSVAGYLFWSDVGNNPKIERSTLAGKDRKTIVIGNMRWPNDLAIDYNTKRLYWSDSIKQTIESVDFNGGNRRLIFNTISRSVRRPISISFFMGPNVAYVTDLYSVYRMATPTSNRTYIRLLQKADIRQIRILQNFTYNATMPCSTNQCSHLCLKASRNTHMCACPTGMKLAPNSSTTCVDEERMYEIYFADSRAKTVNHLIKYDSQDGFTTKPIPAPTKDLQYPVGLDYDAWSKFIYWSDHQTNKIYRMYEDGSNFTEIISNVRKPSGVAVDKITKTLYFFGDDGRSLIASSLNGTYNKTLFFNGLQNPTDIVLYEEKGYIFYSDDEFGYLMRINTDGSGYIRLRGRKRNITAIAIDKIENRVYWCENDQYSIASTDLNFNNFKVVIQKTILLNGVFYIQRNVGNVIDPYGIAIFGDKIFWTDTYRRAIFAADKHSGGNVRYVTGGLDHPRRIHVYNDKPVIEYRKTYQVSVMMINNRSNNAYCHNTSKCSPSMLSQIREPALCPVGYKETNYGSSCANCSDAVSGRLRCFCTDWKTCAQRGYSFVFGCHKSNPFMLFKVRECTQAVHFGTCRYNSSETCPSNKTNCMSDGDCETDQKCCNSSCGFKCMQSIYQTDHPCRINNGGCSHFCMIIESAPYFTCGCPNNMVINSTGKNCVNSTKNLNMRCESPCLYVLRKNSILRIPLNDSTGLGKADVQQVLSFDGHGTALALDPINSYIFWSDKDRVGIYRSTYDGMNKTTLLDYAIGSPSAIAVDWTSNNLYWADKLTETIEVSTTSGKHRKVLFKFTNGRTPHALCVNSIDGYLFWISYGPRYLSPKIERSTLHGGQRMVVVSSRLRWPDDLYIDNVNKRLFWIDSHRGIIESSDFHGNSRQVNINKNIKTGIELNSLSYLPHLGRAYIVNQKTMYSVKNSDSSSIPVIKNPNYIGSFHQLRMALNISQYNVTKPCSTNECSHLCLKASRDSHMCACPTGMKLNSSTTCVEENRLYEIYFADSRAKTVNHLIKYQSQEGFTTKPIPAPEKELQYPVGIDYDAWSKYIYWSDHHTKMIYRMLTNGTQFESVQSVNGTLHGLAFDKISKLLYWFDNYGRTLKVSSSDGRFVRTLVDYAINNPTDLILYEEKGLLFFSAAEIIVRINTNGENRKTYTSKLQHVTGLAIDKFEDRLYFCDQGSYSIRSTDLNFRDHRLLIQKSVNIFGKFYIVRNTGNVIEPFGLAVQQDQVFWTDTYRRAIFAADKHSGDNVTYVTGGLDHPRRIHVYNDMPMTDLKKKLYLFSFYSFYSLRGIAICFRRSCPSSLLFYTSNPAKCPRGYRESRLSSTCSSCSDPVGANFRCQCTNWMTCAQRGYSSVVGCSPASPFMFFIVRECIQDVHLGVCKYNTSSICQQNNTKACITDGDCTTNEKCCKSPCGLKCVTSIATTDHPCTINNGGCSHFCTLKTSSYRCSCPDNMIIDRTGKNCILKTAVNETDVCVLPKHYGPCHSLSKIYRWYFNNATGKCEKFVYGGCGGNRNNFATKYQCQLRCSDNACSYPKDSGHCMAYFLRWYYNEKTKRCETFAYGGCGGNANRFLTKEKCERNCSQPACEQNHCENNGTCIKCPSCPTTKFSCRCKENYYGQRCQLYAGNDVVSVKFGKKTHHAVSSNDLRKTFAKYMALFCFNNTCVYESSTQRKRRESPVPNTFQSTDMVVDITFEDDKELDVKLLVLKPTMGKAVVTGYVKKKSTQLMLDTYGNQIANDLGLAYGKLPANDKQNEDNGKKTKTAVLIVVLVFIIIIIAVLLFTYYKCTRKKQKEPAVSYGVNTFNNELYNDLNQEHPVQAAEKNTSFSNPIYEIPENDAEMGAAAADNPVNSSVIKPSNDKWVQFGDEKNKPDSWVEFDDADEKKLPITDFVAAELELGDPFNIEPPEYSSRVGTPMPQHTDIPARAISTTSLGLPPRYSSIGTPEVASIHNENNKPGNQNNVQAKTITVSENTDC